MFSIGENAVCRAVAIRFGVVRLVVRPQVRYIYPRGVWGLPQKKIAI